jgi:hypothetical protein
MELQAYYVSTHIIDIIKKLKDKVTFTELSLDPTKCLNTVIAILYLSIGLRSIQVVKYCHYTSLLKRIKLGLQDNQRIIESILKDTSTVDNAYYAVFVYNFQKINNKLEVEKKLGGHSFIIGKEGDRYYNFQSYLHKYSLKDQLKWNHTFDLKGLKTILKYLSYICSSKVWDSYCMKGWKEMTFVDTSELIGLPINLEISCVRISI